MISLTRAGGSQQEIGQEWLMTARPNVIGVDRHLVRDGLCGAFVHEARSGLITFAPAVFAERLNLLIRTIAPIAASGKTGNEATNWQLSPIIEDGGIHRLSL